MAQRTLRAFGLAVVLCTLLLAWPGIRAVRADEAHPQAPDTTTTDASFEGFSSYVQAHGRAVPVAEEAGPTCNQPSPLAPEIAHRQAMALLQAKLIADMQARGIDPANSEVVVLNGSGYNYRPVEPGMPGVPVPNSGPSTP